MKRIEIEIKLFLRVGKVIRTIFPLRSNGNPIRPNGPSELSLKKGYAR
jgi:hypothetical protein